MLSRLAQSRALLVAMILIQLLWLAFIWFTNAAGDPQKLLPLFVYSLGAGILVLFLPAGILRRLNEFKNRLVRDDRLFLAILLLTALGVGIIYARTQRIWPFDEENSLAAAERIATRGLEIFFRRYARTEWLGLQHPPLMIMLYGGVTWALGPDPFWARLVPLALLLVTLVVTWALGRELYDRENGVLAATVFLTFPLVMRQGTAAMLDIPTTCLFALALYLVLRLQRTTGAGYLVLPLLVGVTIGLGLVARYTMLFIFGVIVAYLVFIPSFRKTSGRLGIASLIALGILSVWLFYSAQIGVLSAQLEHVTRSIGGFNIIRQVTGVDLRDSILQDLPANDDRPLQGLRNFRLGAEVVFTRLPSAVGVYNVPWLLIGAWAMLRRRNRSDLFVLLWIGVVSLALFITLPDHRYFMPVFPALALVMAQGLVRVPARIEQALLLSLLYWAGSLYLFVDWYRTSNIFMP